MFGNHAIAGASISGFTGSRNFIFLQSRRITRYRAVMTGTANALPDINLPISAFSFSNSSTGLAYLSVTIPGIDLAGDIAARPNGSVRIWFRAENENGMTAEMQFADVAPSTITVYEGASSKSIVIVGYRAMTNTSPLTHVLTDVMFRSDGGGITRYRMEYDPNIQVGDSVTHRTTTSKITQLSGYASASQSVLEVAA